ncbi:MAG: hypothetical protein IJ562_06745 [Prevotella sp.]|nr:hypothetical protein [Prevotella sp.]
MNRVKRIYVWLRRLPHSFGFGIQSPWAYQFDRNVVNEHTPYYAYADLDAAIPELDPIIKKLSRLYFRIANFRQPHRIIDYGSDTHAYGEYMKAACKDADIVEYKAGCSESHYKELLTKEKRLEFVRLSLTGDYRMFYSLLRSMVDKDTIIVLQHIYKSRDTRRFWREILNGSQEIVTFDLYYCGVVFFDKMRYKENYIINF